MLTGEDLNDLAGCQGPNLLTMHPGSMEAGLICENIFTNLFHP